jgi:hypothetical protein
MVAFERTFSMSAFEGVRQIRVRRAETPMRAVEEIVEIIRKVDADGGTYDFEAASFLDLSLALSCPANDANAFYRDCIETCIRHHQPSWARTITYGRKFVQRLTSDEQQCFEAAGLMDDPPSVEVVSWWDRTAAIARLVGDGFRMDQARAAEKLTLEYEARRMAKLGIPGEPKWMSVDDNQLGYDILSVDRGQQDPVSRVLEVKSTIASPLRFYVTRNEWDVCQKMGSAYHFHIWDMNSKTLYERTAAEVQQHIPLDQGAGRWSVAEIRVGAGPSVTV